VTFTKFLLDECISTELVKVANENGYFALHVGQSEKLKSSSDWDLVKETMRNDYIFVTNNARDFIPLYQKLNIHNGLVIFVPNARKDVQARLFMTALARLEQEGDFVNKLVRVYYDEHVTIEDLPR
jgi:predicted nuclease of predicted toxin-antitoxin system